MSPFAAVLSTAERIDTALQSLSSGESEVDALKREVERLRFELAELQFKLAQDQDQDSAQDQVFQEELLRAAAAFREAAAQLPTSVLLTVYNAEYFRDVRPAFRAPFARVLCEIAGERKHDPSPTWLSYTLGTGAPQ